MNAVYLDSSFVVVARGSLRICHYSHRHSTVVGNLCSAPLSRGMVKGGFPIEIKSEIRHLRYNLLFS